MRSADRSGAEIALIIGEQELADQTVAIRMLRDEEAAQTIVSRDEILREVERLLGFDS
jgi:histidyl-tRNA synthetase